ncbi:MAG: hypothetical protein A2539_10060 [Elusimicrobia bacterium RIFOXYD2_FULL_34_15]|nr:MAG: hypothetical protein A2539_10060 [Elusimicrobia bacterium RIFOXYD2_FULL_34_15]
MCRMLGVVSKDKISYTLLDSFKQLALTGRIKKNMTEGHQDGWGIAGYLGERAVHFGRSCKNVLEDIDSFVASSHKAIISNSKITVAHLRKASEGDLRIENTHPFISDDFVFCHNGTIYNSEKLILSNCNYEGTTDSERFLKFLLSKIANVSKKRYPEIIKSVIEEIKEKCKFTSLTFLLSDGENLIGYRNYCEDREYYTLYHSNQKGLSIICSEELPGFEWTLMENEELIIFDKNGESNEFREIFKRG